MTLLNRESCFPPERLVFQRLPTTWVTAIISTSRIHQNWSELAGDSSDSSRTGWCGWVESLKLPKAFSKRNPRAFAIHNDRRFPFHLLIVSRAYPCERTVWDCQVGEHFDVFLVHLVDVRDFDLATRLVTITYNCIIYIYLSIYLAIYLSIHLSIYLSINLT